MNNIIKRKWNQNSMVIIEDLQGMAFQAESGGHTFQISGIDGEGNAIALSGTPAGVMLRSDGQDVTLTCSVSGGVVFATLPANAYSVPGRFGLTIFLTSDGQKTAIYAAVGTVGKTSSGTVAPPAGSDVVTLVNQINTAIAAIPANYNACFAPTYSTSGLYSVGQYVMYNGSLYRCTTAITSGESWTAAHWTQTNMGDETYALKSALTNKTDPKGNAVIGDLYGGELIESSLILGGGTGCIFTVDVGETISFGTETYCYHCYVNVTEGQLYELKILKWETTKRYHVVFTDDNGVVIALFEKGNGVRETVTDVYGVPKGATRMYAFARTTYGPGSGNSNFQIRILSVEVTETVDNITEANNLSGAVENGYWLNASMTTKGGTNENYRSIKQTLSPGEYTISFGADVELIRICIDEGFCDQSVLLSAGEAFSFYCLKNVACGFSFRKQNDTAWDSWVQVEKTGVAFGKNDISGIDLETRKNLSNGDQQIIIKTIRKKDLLNGYWTGGTYTKGTTRLTTYNLYPVKKGDVVLLNNKEIAVMFIYFDATRSVMYATTAVSSGYIGGRNIKADAYIIEEDGYITFNLYNRINGSTASISRDDYDNIMSIISIDNKNVQYSAFSGTAMLGNMKARKLNAYIHGQDGCIVGNYLYSFADGVSNPGQINKINLETMETVAVGTHQLGHMNSVDYDESVNTLITYGGNGANQPTIVLYKNPDFSGNLALTDSGCTVIPLYNSSGHMNVSGAVCYGEAPNIAYFVEGVYSDSSNTINPVRNIYKILLGMGDNDLSDNGYGTFVSGKSENEYNGTCKIIKTYTGEIVPGIHCFANANSLWTPQGMKYNGYLFLAYGTAGNNYLKIVLDDHANRYIVANNYYFEVLAYNGNVVPCEPEMLAVDGDVMYCGVNDRETHANYLYEIKMV